MDGPYSNNVFSVDRYTCVERKFRIFQINRQIQKIRRGRNGRRGARALLIVVAVSKPKLELVTDPLRTATANPN